MQPKQSETGDIVLLIESLPSVHKVVGTLPSWQTTQSLSFQAKSAESEVQGHLHLHMEFKSSPGYMRPHASQPVKEQIIMFTRVFFFF